LGGVGGDLDCWLEPQGSPHSGLILGDMKESGGWLPGDGMNRAEPMMVLF
jgi:hypothetical protein